MVNTDRYRRTHLSEYDLMDLERAGNMHLYGSPYSSGFDVHEAVCPRELRGDPVRMKQVQDALAAIFIPLAFPDSLEDRTDSQPEL